MIGPRNAVKFSSQAQAPSLVEEICTIAKCETAQAEDIYQRWLQKTRQENTLRIEGIGKLIDKSFVEEPTFTTAINPRGVRTLVVHRSKSHMWVYVISGVCAVVALILFGLLLWGEPKSLIGTDEAVTAQESVPATEAVVPSGTAEGIAVEPADSLQQSVTPESPGETKQVVETTPADYKYYVVMGIFSSEQNAQRAVEQAQSKIKDVQCVILPFKQKHMVTLFGCDSRSDCNAFAKSYSDIYPDLWVYEKK